MKENYIALVETFIITAVYLFIGLLVELIWNLILGDRLEYEIGNFLCSAISEAIRIAVFAVLLCALQKEKPNEKRHIGIKKQSMLMFLIIIIPIAFMIVYKTVCIHFGYEYDVNSNLELRDWVMVFLTPFAEEITFRGCMISLARKRGINEKMMIVVSAIAWAVLHPYNIIMVVSIFIVGLLYGIIYSKTGSLKYGIVSHVIYNLISILGY